MHVKMIVGSIVTIVFSAAIPVQGQEPVNFQSTLCDGALGVHQGSNGQHTRVTFLRTYAFDWVFNEGGRVTSMQTISGIPGQVVEAISPKRSVTVAISCK